MIYTVKASKNGIFTIHIDTLQDIGGFCDRLIEYGFQVVEYRKNFEMNQSTIIGSSPNASIYGYARLTEHIKTFYCL